VYVLQLTLVFDHSNWSVTDEDLIYLFEHMTYERIEVNVFNATQTSLSDRAFQQLVYFNRPVLSSEELVVVKQACSELQIAADKAQAIFHRLGGCNRVAL
jgi:hypothetical protein